VTDAAVRQLVNAVLVPGLGTTVIPDWLASDLDRGLGGVCWFGGDPGSATADIHARRSGALVLSDEEGGNVTRLESATGSSWPGNAALGVVDDVEATEQVAAGIGAQARRAGIDVVLAPVVDVNSDPENPVIGVRSFGDQPDLVARHGAAFVRGVQALGVAACAKHFPGHGATRTDSHVVLPVVDDDRGTIMGRDVPPFAAAVEAGVRCVLTAHVSMPAVDGTPATMSATWLALLREELRFDGVIISDALDMHAISRGVGRGPGAVAALQAGVDLICIGNPDFPERYDGAAVLAEVRAAVVDAIESGALPVSRLEHAAARLAGLSDWLETTRDAVPEPPVSSAPHLGRDIARRAISTTADVRLDGPPVVVVEDHTDIAAGRRPSRIVDALTARNPGTTSLSLRSLGDLAHGDAIRSERPVVFITDGRAGAAMRRAVRAIRPDTIVVWTGSLPLPASAPIDGAAVFAFGSGAANAAAVAELLMPS